MYSAKIERDNLDQEERERETDREISLQSLGEYVSCSSINIVKMSTVISNLRKAAVFANNDKYQLKLNIRLPEH